MQRNLQGLVGVVVQAAVWLNLRKQIHRYAAGKLRNRSRRSSRQIAKELEMMKMLKMTKMIKMKEMMEMMKMIKMMFWGWRMSKKNFGS